MNLFRFPFRLARKISLTAAMAGVLGTAALFPAKATDTLAGRAIHVDDGDTIALLVPGNDKIKVRLASIDAPESAHTNREKGRVGQPFSENSKRALAAMVKGKDVQARCHDTDRYGRRVCSLYVQGLDVNAEMVRAGWAWANTSGNGRYLRDRTFIGLQEQARSERRGLWAGHSQVAPWDWRKSCWTEGQCPN